MSDVAGILAIVISIEVLALGLTLIGIRQELHRIADCEEIRMKREGTR